MTADEGGQHFPDRGAVGRRIAGDPLQRIDPAQPDVKPVRARLAELVDRAGEPLLRA